MLLPMDTGGARAVLGLVSAVGYGKLQKFYTISLREESMISAKIMYLAG